MSKCAILVTRVRLYRGMLLSGILLEQEKQQDQSFLPFSISFSLVERNMRLVFRVGLSYLSSLVMLVFTWLVAESLSIIPK